jgi:hypothetical protein
VDFFLLFGKIPKHLISMLDHELEARVFCTIGVEEL